MGSLAGIQRVQRLAMPIMMVRFRIAELHSALFGPRSLLAW